jgi:hypothetical protein
MDNLVDFQAPSTCESLELQGALPKLRNLNLKDTKITSLIIPAGMENLFSITFPDSCKSVTFQGNLPENFRYFDLNLNEVTTLTLEGSLQNSDELNLSNTKIKSLIVLTNINSIKTLSLSNFMDLGDVKGLEKLENLKNFHITSPKISSVTIPAGMENLQSITFPDSCTSVTFQGDLLKMKKLDLMFTKIISLTIPEAMKNKVVNAPAGMKVLIK